MVPNVPGVPVLTWRASDFTAGSVVTWGVYLIPQAGQGRLPSAQGVSTLILDVSLVPQVRVYMT